MQKQLGAGARLVHLTHGKAREEVGERQKEGQERERERERGDY